MAKDSKWEIFHVIYQNPKFGSDPVEYLPEEHTFMVSTQGGVSDARKACEKYHSNCKITAVLDHMSVVAGITSAEIRRAAENGSRKTTRKTKK